MYMLQANEAEQEARLAAELAQLHMREGRDEEALHFLQHSLAVARQLRLAPLLLQVGVPV